MNMQPTFDSCWSVFIEILSDEFTEKTGFGVYAHISPTDVSTAFQQYKQLSSPMRAFVRNYVRDYV